MPRVTITGWENGLGASAYKGFYKIVGMDIYRKPGIIQSGISLANTGLSLTGYPTATCIDPLGSKYIGTSDGYVYKDGVQIASGRGVIHDIIYVADYILISRSGNGIDVYGTVSSSPTYTNDKFTATNFTTSTYGWKKMFVGQDNVVYIGNENRLATITNIYTTVTSAGDGPVVNAIASWVLNSSCFSTGMPAGRIIQTICEYNRYVCIVTCQGDGNSGNTRIYFMDRGNLDPSKTSFSLSIGVDIPERRVRQIINQNNRLIFFGPDTGTFYTTNTVTYSVLAQIPGRLQGQTFTVYPNAITIVNNEVLFGVGGVYNSAYDTVYGVYSMRDGSLICKNVISSGSYGQTQAVYITAIQDVSIDTYLVGWQDGSTYGIDTSGTTIGTNFNVWVESPMFDIGNPEMPATFNTLRVELGTNLATPTSGNQRLRISYRGAMNEAYRYINVNGTTDGIIGSPYLGKNAIHLPAKISATDGKGMVGIQVKVEFDTGTATYGQNIELRNIALE